MSNLLLDIGIVIIVATLGGMLARFIKQPLIPAYILAGVIIGPLLGIITDGETVTILAEIGITFLLFIVGLELDLRRLREIGAVASFGGALQIIVLFFLGLLTAFLLGYTLLPAVYIGIIMAFSSTMVVIKILSDKNQLDTLHGRIILGFLLMQDIFAIIALSVLNKIGGSGGPTLLHTLLVGAALIVLAIALAKWIFPPLFTWAARTPELLFLLAITTCFGFAFLFSLAGFSLIIGAFIAGILLGNLPYNVEIISRVMPLKDFFSVLFFVSIGLQLTRINWHLLWPFIILLLFTIIILPIITIMICSIFGYKRRTAFIVGIGLAQLSEFSLIIVTQGRILGHIGDDIFNLTILLTLITIALTSYLIKYQDKLYDWLKRYLGVFENISKINKALENISDDHDHKVVMVGYDRTGYSIFRTLRRLKKDFVVIDYDPDVIRRLIEEKVPCIYGDIGDIEILEKLKLHNVELVISTAPHHANTMLLIKTVKNKNKHASIIVTSSTAEEALELYDVGADYVIVPHYLGGEHISIMLEDITDDIDQLIQRKIEHIKELHYRREYHKKKRK